MSADLAARLALLANETPVFEDGKRILSDDDSFAAIIHLIDQTVLSTLLQIENGVGVLKLEVSGRRLSRIPGHVEDMAGDDAAVKTAATMIAEFADQSTGPLRVSEEPGGQADADSAQSVSITALAGAAGRVMIDESAEPLVQFEARLGDSLTGSIFLAKGEVTERIGNVKALDADVEALCALATDGPSLVVFDMQGGQFTGAAFVGDDAMIFAVQADDLGKLIAQFDRSAGL